MSTYRTRTGGYRTAYANESYYIDGNTVRKREYAPRETRRPRTDRHRGQERHEKKTQVRVQTFSLGYILFLICMILVLMGGCIYYLELRNDLTRRQKEITELESTLNTLRLKNDEEYDRIIGAVDMEMVKKTAMEDLGMTYPGAEQVVGISGTGGDYVRQYKEIPKDERKK